MNTSYSITHLFFLFPLAITSKSKYYLVFLILMGHLDTTWFLVPREYHGKGTL